MEEKRVNELKQQFKKTYFDTIKHEENIEKWINSGKRKQGDIRRSLQKLDFKYENLVDIKRKLEIQGIYEESIIPKDGKGLLQIENKIKDLYKSAKIDLPKEHKKSSKYNNEIELATDIPGNENGLFYLERRRRNKVLKRKQKSRRKKFDIKGAFLDTFYKIKYSFENRKNKENRKHKKVGRISAALMAGTLAFFGATTVGESNANTIKNDKNEKSYVDINKEKNDFKESLYIQVLETNTDSSTEPETTIKMNEQKETWNTQATQSTFVQPTTEAIESKRENNINKNQNAKKEEKTKNQQDNKTTEYKESTDEIYILRANTSYTENSLGTGASGYVSKDSKVKIYNRALVKTDKEGNKSILNVTNVGQTWEEFAKEQGIDYKEFKTYIENNPNIQEMISVQSDDGNTLYGWISKDKLEKVEEMER